MARVKNSNQKKTNNGANVGYEAELWQMADALRGSMDAAEYKHVVLGLIFLKYISDAFEEQHAKLEAERTQGADPEDPDEYRALNIFWVPPEARWTHLKAQAKQPTIGPEDSDDLSFKFALSSSPISHRRFSASVRFPGMAVHHQPTRCTPET